MFRGPVAIVYAIRFEGTIEILVQYLEMYMIVGGAGWRWLRVAYVDSDAPRRRREEMKVPGSFSVDQ